MVHPIFSVLITKPELVMEHVAGYAALMRDEASSVGKEVAKRAVAWAVTLFSLLVFLILAGVAAMPPKPSTAAMSAMTRKTTA